MLRVAVHGETRKGLAIMHYLPRDRTLRMERDLQDERVGIALDAQPLRGMSVSRGDEIQARVPRQPGEDESSIRVRRHGERVIGPARQLNELASNRVREMRQSDARAGDRLPVRIDDDTGTGLRLGAQLQQDRRPHRGSEPIKRVSIVACQNAHRPAGVFRRSICHERAGGVRRGHSHVQVASLDVRVEGIPTSEDEDLASGHGDAVWIKHLAANGDRLPAELRNHRDHTDTRDQCQCSKLRHALPGCHIHVGSLPRPLTLGESDGFSRTPSTDDKEVARVR